MSATYYCYSCYVQLPATATSGGVCNVCQMKIASKNAPQQGAVQVVVWNNLPQTAAFVQPGREPGLTPEANYIDEVMACINDHIGDTAGTNFGDQYTIWKGGGTPTVDYQGTRAGSGATFWIDIQGQVGGGGSKRKTYWQILVECAGTPPPRDNVVNAIAASHASNVASGKRTQVGQRIVIVRGNTVGRPN
ncbi:hypothetical protein J5Y09_13370 [Roseomonas sp. PWR1]|uniref:Uncharacterized protein n=1 Tax=Roseomonas nitratireducens TaxID=2820810 RepID=A0ABS4AVW0_9PROT|nr:hypothetical protein [Neoroseomonas nitratireducens]MBP0464906.1 hypothetical protein [Neoroseomonas nitratireducens]